MSVFGPRRWWVLRALGKNPLVRRADRFEALTVIFAMVVTVLAIPHAVGFGEDVYGGQLRQASVQAQTRTPIQATVVSDSETSVEGDGVRLASVQWTVAGSEHTGVIRPSRPTKAGEQVQIWVDEKGRRVPAPISASTATAIGTGAAIGMWLGTILLCGLVIAATRRLLNRYRVQAWSSELQVLLDHGDGRTKWPR